MTPQEERMFNLGKRAGQEEIRDKIIEALDLKELIADAIEAHENFYHGVD